MSREANAARAATTTDDGPTYATATLASLASAAVTGESTSSPTPGTHNASPRASAETEDNAATAATSKPSQGSTPRPSLTNLVRFIAGKGNPQHIRPPTATLSGRLRRHGERGRNPTTTHQTAENSATWSARSIPS